MTPAPLRNTFNEIFTLEYKQMPNYAKLIKAFEDGYTYIRRRDSIEDLGVMDL